MKFRLVFAVLALIAALAASSAVAQTTPNSATAPASDLKVQKLADGVWAAEPAKGANVGWFLLGDGVVVVDSGADSGTAREILKQVAETTGNKPVQLLILTHAHADHSGGARAFVAAGARILCQESIAGAMLAYVTQPSSDRNDPLSGKTNIRPIVESISERSIMVDGIHNTQIYFLGAAHSSGDLVVYLSGDKILFSGDIALGGRQPFMQSPDVDPVGWERALQSLTRVPVDKLVPGHGDIGPVTGIQDSLAYVSRVTGLARKWVESGTREEQIDALIRAPENAIPNVPLSDSHLANVKASYKAMKEKASRKAATPAPGAAPKTTPAK
jgi:cyclase